MRLIFDAIVASLSKAPDDRATKAVDPEGLARRYSIALAAGRLLGLRGVVAEMPIQAEAGATRRWCEAAVLNVGVDPVLMPARAALSDATIIELSRLIEVERPSDIRAFHDRLLALSEERSTGRRRRMTGRYHTPSAVAAYIAEQGINVQEDTTAERILEIRVLDPAAGNGVFLQEAARYLARCYARRCGATEQAALHQVISRCLYGVELDAESLIVAQWSLLVLGADETLPWEVLGHLVCGNYLLGAELEDLPWPANGDERRLLLSADALTASRLDTTATWPDPATSSGAYLDRIEEAGLMDKVSRMAGRAGYFHCSLQFEPARGSGFDAVIGNPPYLSEVRGGSATFAELRRSPKCAGQYVAKGDLSDHFMQLSVRRLVQGGRLAFLVPPYWRTRSSARRLREYLKQETSPRLSVDFGECRLFPDARGHHSEIVVLERGGGYDDPVAYLVMDSSARVEVVLGWLRDEHTVPGRLELVAPSQAKSRPVCKPTPSDPGGRQRHRPALPTTTLTRSRIVQGLVMPQATLSSSGFRRLRPSVARPGDGIFWLRRSEMESLSPNLLERALAKDYLPAACIHPFFAGSPRGFVLYLDSDTTKQLLSHPERYPALVAHLTRFAPAITSSHGPFGLHRPRTRKWFETPLRLGVVRKGPYVRAARFTRPCYVDQSVNVVLLENSQEGSYLLGLLCSRFAWEWFFRKKRQGDFLQIDKDVLCELPIPDVGLPTRSQVERYRRYLRAEQLERIREEVERAWTDNEPTGLGSGEPGWEQTEAASSSRASRQARAAIEAVVERLERHLAASATSPVGPGDHTERPGRGGFFRKEIEEGDPFVKRLRSILDEIVDGLYARCGFDRTGGTTVRA